MGVETAVAAGSAIIGGATAIYGANEAKKGRKAATKASNEAMAFQAEQTTKADAAQAKLSQQQAEEKKKINQGIARAGRRRIRGGLFGDSEATPGSVSATLG